jgi:hypothetical protein
MKTELPYEEIAIPDYREILDDGRRMLIEATVKHNGVWRIHKSDPDILFPSDFHADRVDEREKLDIYTGDVFSSVNNKFLRTEPKKAMRYIFRELQKSKEERIKECLKNTAKFSYLC